MACKPCQAKKRLLGAWRHSKKEKNNSPSTRVKSEPSPPSKRK